MKRLVIWIVLWVVLILVVLFVGAYAYLRLGLLDLHADMHPSAFETRQAGAIFDASTERHAPNQKNPLQPTNANLLQGMKLYRDHCAMCHGAPDHPERKFGHPFYPPAPQFTEDAPDLPENQSYYVIQHGVRWTGMPAWGNTLSGTQMWKLVTFLSHMGKLPPPLAKQWRASRRR